MVTDVKVRLDGIENKFKSADIRRKLIESYTNINQLTRDIVEELIEYVYVGKKDPVTKEILIEIHWNFLRYRPANPYKYQTQQVLSNVG